MPIEFPVKVPYSTTPNMVRNTGAVFNSKPSRYYLEQKRLELIARGDDLYATTWEADVNHLIRKANEYCGQPGHFSITQLALSIEEDIAIMHKGMLAAICFCFPSSWTPKERIGMPLMKIHEAVADGDKLITASQRIAETMASVEQGSFRRHVWTICNSGELSQHPARKSSVIPQSIDELFYRVETQTTAPLGDGDSSLFFVKVETCPLAELWADAEKRELIKESVSSMTDDVLDYKNLHHIKTLLI
jgi:hypothetical protein